MKSFFKTYNLMQLFLGIALMVCPLIGFSQDSKTSQNIDAILKIEKGKNESLAITGMVENMENNTKQLRYELSVIISNSQNGNSSKNKQSGSFTLEPHESKNLSRTVVSTGPGSKSIVLLSIFKDNLLVEKTKKVLYPE